MSCLHRVQGKLFNSWRFRKASGALNKLTCSGNHLSPTLKTPKLQRPETLLFLLLTVANLVRNSFRTACFAPRSETPNGCIRIEEILSEAKPQIQEHTKGDAEERLFNTQKFTHLIETISEDNHIGVNKIFICTRFTGNQPNAILTNR